MRTALATIRAWPVALRASVAMVCALDLWILASVGSPRLLAAPPSETKSCCKLSRCVGAVEVKPESGGWTDGCEKDASGNCDTSTHCYTCSGASRSTDLCYYTGRSNEHCTSDGISNWQYYNCGHKIRQECRNGGGSVSGCCTPGLNPQPVDEACMEPKCLPGVSTLCQ